MYVSMFDKIQDSCAYVMKNSKYVHINYKKLDDFIKNIEIRDLKHWLISNPYNLFDMGIEKIVNFLLISVFVLGSTYLLFTLNEEISISGKAFLSIL